MIKRLSNNSSYYKERKLKRIKIGQHVVPLWLIITLLLSGVFIAALADYLWTSVIVDLEVEEPLEILHYPDELSLYPGETKEFNVTVMNYASVNYAVVLGFSLGNLTYQENYVTFSDETYLVVPDEQNLTAWLHVEAVAPPIETSLTIDFHRIADGVGELVFFDDFNDGSADGWTVQFGNFAVIDGEYYTENGAGQKSLVTVDGLDLADCVVEVNLRCLYAFQAALVFRYTDNAHHYTFSVNDEGDCVGVEKYVPGNEHFGEVLGVNYSVSISLNTDYLVSVRLEGNQFTCFLDGEKVLTVTDDAYTSGQVGLRGQKADVFFDDFRVYSIP